MKGRMKARFKNVRFTLVLGYLLAVMIEDNLSQKKKIRDTGSRLTGRGSHFQIWQLVIIAGPMLPGSLPCLRFP